ncbi:oligopeptidase A [Achromatium sp. WMS3]|nr:oligopeptidase A [Achromatium sp. WMS3]
MDNNPLLNHTDLPQFSKIRPEHIEPAIDYTLANNRAKIAQILEQQITWENCIEPIEAMGNYLQRTWSPAGHLNAVVNSPELRDAYNACLPKLSAYATEMGQNEKLYQAYKAVAAKEVDLDVAQRKVLELSLQDFQLSGVDLPPEQKTRFKEIQQRLSQLGSNFSENLLDATQGWERLITDPIVLAGLPQSALDMLRQNANNKGQDGWLLTLDAPSYVAIITYTKDRKLRQEIYTAYTTRASDQGPNAGQWDNSAVIDETLRLRHELAQILGFKNYAERSLATKMASSTTIVLDFLEDLVRRSRPQAMQEFAELSDYARSQDGLDHLEAWDIPYYSEQLRQARYAISQEELRPYFPLPKVIAGLFAIATRLFGIQITELQNIDTWHPDVTCYQIQAADGTVQGYFYLDPYARNKKRSGAWMDECIGRMRHQGKLQIPAAYLVCNFPAPLNNRPALLTHDDVCTLFHEFGHGLQHLLTQVEQPAVAGINGVVWDAVELPSQFLENWCWEREALDLFARHWEIDQPLPEDLYQKMRKAKNFQAAMGVVRQLEFALFDFRLHQDYNPAQGSQVLEILNKIRSQVAVISYPAFNRFPHNFSHIFSGGYAAGYYSYKWAEVLSADAFAVFEERGLFDQASGQAFKQHILEPGGSIDANDLFIAFRGRKPSIEALLRHNGIGIN